MNAHSFIPLLDSDPRIYLRCGALRSGAFGASTRVELAPPWTPQHLDGRHGRASELIFGGYHASAEQARPAPAPSASALQARLGGGARPTPPAPRAPAPGNPAHRPPNANSPRPTAAGGATGGRPTPPPPITARARGTTSALR